MSDDTLEQLRPEEDNDVNARDKLLAELAFEDFCTKIGPNPTPNGLYNFYVQVAHDHPELEHTIPSRSRNKIYGWNKAYRWEERYRLRALHQLEADRDWYEETRRRNQYRLTSLVDSTLEEAHSLLENSTNENVKAKMIQMIWDRTGLIDQSKVRYNQDKAVDPKPSETPNLPESDASKSELLEWMRANQKG